MTKITTEYAVTYADGSTFEEDSLQDAESQVLYAQRMTAQRIEGWEGARIVTRTITVTDWQ